MHIVKNFQPQDIAQVERIAMICHLQECTECSQFILEQIEEHGIQDNPEVKSLAEMDRMVV
jgi:hypothetical protein